MSNSIGTPDGANSKMNTKLLSTIRHEDKGSGVMNSSMSDL